MDFALNRAFICKWENLNITSSGISSKVFCVPCCLVACFSSVELLCSLVPAATVSTTCASFVLLSSTSAVHFHDHGLWWNCLCEHKSRNVFNERLRKLIVLCCCCCQGWKLSWRLIDVWCLWWKEFSNGTGTVQLVTGTLSLTIIFTSYMIIIVRYYVAGSTCNLLVLNNRGGVHVQYSATVLQYHTGILILQYCVQ